MTERKTYRARMEFKEDGEPGMVSAVFSTLNVIDLDRDVTLPGAFEENAPVRIAAWNHGWNELPVGRGEIHETDSEARMDGRFFLHTLAGKEHYLTVKALGDLQEWSYSFDILESEYGKKDDQDVRFLKRLKVHEVSPVMLGAGIDTRTLDIKAAKRAIASHSTPTVEGAWDGPANEARARSGEDLAYYRRIFAWRDPDGDPTVKSTYKFVHHMVSAGGEPGAANVRACVTGIAVLNGARGGTTIPSADRQGVWNHLAKHLRDADVEPPELKAATAKALEMLRAYLEAFGETEDEAGDGKSREKPGVMGARIALDIVEYGLPALQEGA